MNDQFLFATAPVSWGVGDYADESWEQPYEAIVDEIATWRSLRLRSQPLILVANSDAVVAEAGGLARGLTGAGEHREQNRG